MAYNLRPGEKMKVKNLDTQDEELIAAYSFPPSCWRAAGGATWEAAGEPEEAAWEAEEAWGCAPFWTGDLERLDLHPFGTEALRGSLDGRTETPDPKAAAGDAGRLSTSWARDLMATGDLFAPKLEIIFK